MPQLDFSFYLSQITWLVVSFSLFFCISKFLILPRLDIILKTRSNMIEENLTFATNTTNKANALIDDCNKKMDKVKADLEKKVALCVKECREKQEYKLNEFNKKMTAEVQQKIVEVKNEVSTFNAKINDDMVEIVKTILQKVYAIKATDDEIKKNFKKIEL